MESFPLLVVDGSLLSGLSTRTPMHYRLLALSLFISAALHGAQETAAPVIPPSLKLELVINGKTYEASTSATVTADIGGKKVEIVISEKPTKTFRYSGVAFEFPKNHIYTFQALPNLDMWTLNGSENTVMVFVPKVEPEIVLNDMIKEVVQKYGKGNTKVTKCEQTFGNVKVSGQRLTAILAQEKIVQELYLVTKGKNKIILLLQDSPQDDGGETAETASVRKLLSQTFNIKE